MIPHCGCVRDSRLNNSRVCEAQQGKALRLETTFQCDRRGNYILHLTFKLLLFFKALLSFYFLFLIL